MSVTKIESASVYYLTGASVHGDVASPVPGDLAIYTDTLLNGVEFSYSDSGWFQRKQLKPTGIDEIAGLIVEGKLPSAIILAATTVVTGSTFTNFGRFASFQAVSDGSHAGTSTILIDVSNDGTNWALAAITLTVTGAGAIDSEAFAGASWTYARARCSVHGDDTNVVTVTKGG